MSANFSTTLVAQSEDEAIAAFACLYPNTAIIRITVDYFTFSDLNMF